MPEDLTSRIAEVVARLLAGGLLWAAGFFIVMSWFGTGWALWPLLLCLGGGALMGLLFDRHFFETAWATRERLVDALWWWS